MIVSRTEFVRRVPRRKILLTWLISQHPPQNPPLLYRKPQRPDLRFTPPLYPKRRKPIYLLEGAIAPTTAIVPNVVGLSVSNAVSVISNANLVPINGGGAYSSSYLAGIVVSESPAAGSTVAAFSDVSFIYSLGNAPVPVPVPNVIGFSEADAIAALTAAGFGFATQTAVNPLFALGTISAQSPLAGTLEYLPFVVTITIVIAQVWPRPSSITNLPVRGAWELPGGQQAIWVVGNGCYLMTVATPLTGSTQATFALKKVGTLATSTAPVCIRDNGAGGTVVIVDGPNGYYYTFAGAGGTVGNFTKITDPGFLGADRVAFIDGWWIFNQPGTQVFYTPSSTYSITFTSLTGNFALVDSATDLLVTLYENKEELWLLGEKHTEIWYDAGGQYFPFQRLVSTMLQVGCAAKHSIARFSAEGQDGLIWLAKSERGQNVVARTQGFNIRVVSTPPINDAIASYTKIDDAIGYTYQEDGHEFFVLTFPSAQTPWGLGATWVYDGMTDMWHERLSYDPYSQSWNRHRSNCYLDFQNQRLVGDYQNGSIYQMTRQAYTDAGWPLVAWRRTPHVWDGGARERVFMAQLQIEFRPGVGNATGLGTDPQAVLTQSKDGGSTYGQEIRRAIGRIGNYIARTIWRRLGVTRDSVFDVKVYDPVNRDVVGATLRRLDDGPS